MRSERRSLLRLRGEGGEGLRRRRGGLRLLSLRREFRCLNDIGLLARLCGDDLLGLDLCPHDIKLFRVILRTQKQAVRYTHFCLKAQTSPAPHVYSKQSNFRIRLNVAPVPLVTEQCQTTS